MKFVLGAIKDTQLRKTITFGYLLMDPVLTIKQLQPCHKRIMCLMFSALVFWTGKWRSCVDD